MPRKSERETIQSAIAKTLELVGDWWTLLIVRDAMMGLKRFDEFHTHLGIARNILSSRMKRLVDYGLMERRLYVERPARYEYVLTKKGKDLFTTMVAIRQWGDRWFYEDKDLPVLVTHATCGGATHAIVTCEKCGESLTTADDVGYGFHDYGDKSEGQFWAARWGLPAADNHEVS